MIKPIKSIYRHVGAVLKSKDIFSNWFIDSLLYAFSNNPTIKVNCKNGKRLELSKKMYKAIVRGYYYGFIHDFVCLNDKISINGITMRVTPIYTNGYWDFSCCKFKNLSDTIYLTVISQEYSLLNVKNRIIVDIGAYVGDTAIYFSLRGAKRIYAVEPHPRAFSEMLENIKLNGLDTVIVPINVAITKNESFLEINGNIVDVESTSMMYYNVNNEKIKRNILKNSYGSAKIQAMRLNTLIKEYGIETDVLKIDCEGCEGDIILYDYESVKKFHDIILECHSRRTCFKILDKLSITFKCRRIEVGEEVSIMHCTSD